MICPAGTEKITVRLSAALWAQLNADVEAWAAMSDRMNAGLTEDDYEVRGDVCESAERVTLNAEVLG